MAPADLSRMSFQYFLLVDVLKSPYHFPVRRWRGLRHLSHSPHLPSVRDWRCAGDPRLSGIWQTISAAVNLLCVPKTQQSMHCISSIWYQILFQKIKISLKLLLTEKKERQAHCPHPSIFCLIHSGQLSHLSMQAETMHNYHLCSSRWSCDAGTQWLTLGGNKIASGHWRALETESLLLMLFHLLLFNTMRIQVFWFWFCG